MAIRFYRPKEAGTKLDLYIDPAEYSEAQDQLDLALVEEIQASSDPIREQLAVANGFANVGDYDAWLEDQIDELKDRLDYYSYENRDEVIPVRDGDWFTPEAVEAVCGEETGSGWVAANMIDDDTQTWWQHNDDEPHEVTLRLRDYRKRVSKIRIRRGNNVRSQLNNLDVRAAMTIANLDNPESLRATGVELTVAQDWNEIDFTSPRNCKYIRLTGFGSAQADDEARIRRIEARVITREP